MCIIQVLKKGTKKNTEDVYNFITCGYENNKEGSGYMYKKNKTNKIVLKKGFFNLEDLLKSLKSEKLLVQDELIVHHRISSIGKVNDLNCHPYVISSIHSEVVATDIITEKPCLVHNGTFKELFDFRKDLFDYSDTYAFARFYMANDNILNIFKENKILFKMYFNNVLGNSKLALLYPDRDLEMFGDFKESNGYYHSNDGYCKVTRDIGGSSTNYGPYANDDAWAEYYRAMDEDYIDRKTKRLAIKNSNESIMGFADKSSFREHSTTTKIIDITPKQEYKKIALDSSSINLNSLNFNDFTFVWKDQYDKRGNMKYNTYILNSYDKEAINQLLERTDLLENNSHYCITTEKLNKDFYFLPKNPDLEQSYKDFLRLLTCKGPIGKKTVKRLDALMTSIQKTKSKYDKVFYHRLGEFVSKHSLSLYKFHLDGLNIGGKKSLKQAILDGEVYL